MDNHCNIGKAGRNVVIILFLYFFSVCFLPACSPKIIERIVVQHDTTAVHHRDSIFMKDSIYIKEWMKGDTIYIDRYRDRYIYKDRWRDSISIREVHDTTMVEKKVEKELTKWQKARINSFWWLIVALGAALIWIFRKPIMKLIKTIMI